MHYYAMHCAAEPASCPGSSGDANSASPPSFYCTIEPSSDKLDQVSHPAVKQLLAELSKAALVLTAVGVAVVGPRTSIHSIAMRAVSLGHEVAEQVLEAIRGCLGRALEHNNWSALCEIVLDFDAGMAKLLRSLGCPKKIIRCARSATAGLRRVGPVLLDARRTAED